MFILFVILSAICNAICDTLLFHFRGSVFSELHPDFWNPANSIKVKKIFKYPVNAWHLFKSAGIVAFGLAVVTYSNVSPFWIVDLVLIGIAWNVAFNLFYDEILPK